MSDELDPRIEAATEAFALSQGLPCHFDNMRAALAAADASDAERGIVRAQQSDIDNDRSRIAAAERAGREIREALGLSLMADWSAVLRAAKLIRGGWSVRFYKTVEGTWVAAADNCGWMTGTWPTIVEAAAAIKARVE